MITVQVRMYVHGINIFSNMSMQIIYRTRTKFRGINFHAVAGSEFRGSIILCGVIFVDTIKVLEKQNKLPAT